MSESIRALENLDTIGVSLVKRGANRYQFIEKNEGIMDQDTIEILKSILSDCPSVNEGESATILKSEETKANGAVLGIARLMCAFKDVLSPEHIAKAQKLAGVDQKEAADGSIYVRPGKVTVKGGKTPKEEYSERDEDEKKMIEDQTKPFKKHDLAPEVQAQLEMLHKANEEAVRKAAESEARVAKMEGEALFKEFVSKAEKEMSHVPGKSAVEIATILKSLHDKDPASAAQMVEVFKATSETMKKSSLLKELGSGHAVQGSVHSQLEGLAKSYVAKSTEGLTYEQAYVRALEAQPELYRQYLAENPQQIR